MPDSGHEIMILLANLILIVRKIAQVLQVLGTGSIVRTSRCARSDHAIEASCLAQSMLVHC
jgi:hypothetical protein